MEWNSLHDPANTESIGGYAEARAPAAALDLVATNAASNGSPRGTRTTDRPRPCRRSATRSSRSGPAPGRPSPANVSTGVMEDEAYRVTVSPRGAIASFVDKRQSNRELAGSTGGFALNDLGSATGRSQSRTRSRVGDPARDELVAARAHDARHARERRRVDDGGQVRRRDQLRRRRRPRPSGPQRVARRRRLDRVNRWSSVVAKGAANNDRSHNYALELSNSGRWQCVLGNGVSAISLRSSSDPQAGRYYHVACVWNGTTLQLHVDGALNATSSQSLAPAVNAAPLYVGQFGGNADRLDGHRRG
jgi:Concanavalin A-like lectin/glucanases superfamily